MNNRTLLISAVSSLLLLILLGAFAASGADYPLTITDSAGRELTFTVPVERVIVLNSDAAEAVTMLGATDKVVGVSDTVTKRATTSHSSKEAERWQVESTGL